METKVLQEKRKAALKLFDQVNRLARKVIEEASEADLDAMVHLYKFQLKQMGGG